MALRDPLDRRSLTISEQKLLAARLAQLRKAAEVDPKLLDWQQANAQLAMAYTLGLAPEPMELRPWFQPTQFFQEHSAAIYEVAKGKLTSSWLDGFAEPKVEFERSVRCQTAVERESHESERLAPQLRKLEQQWLEHPEWADIQKRYHALIEEGNNSGDWHKWAKEHPEWERIKEERARITNFYELKRAKLFADRISGQRLDCETKWICICDPAVSQVCYEATCISRTGLINYRNPETRRPEQVPGVQLYWIDARLRILETIQRLSDPSFLSEPRAARYYPKFLCDARTLPERLETLRRYIDRLKMLPEFAMSAVTIMRESENEVRESYGVPAIGEGWVAETMLFYRLRTLLSNEKVIQHGRPNWLGRQHFDIWIPSRNIAFEYHGQQHFEAVGFFGGETGLVATQQRDAKKRELCARNGVRLVEVPYHQTLTDDELVKLVAQFAVKV